MQTLRHLLFSILFLSAAIGLMAQGPYTITVQGTLANCSPGDSIVVHTGPGIVPIQGTAVAVDEDCSYSATVTLDTSSGSIVVRGFCGITHVVGDTLGFSFNTQVTDTTFWVNLDCNTGNPGDCVACYTVAEDGPFTATFTTCSSSGIPGPYMYTWDFPGPGGGTVMGGTVSHTFPGAGQYTICHSIEDADGCTSTVCHTVYVDEQGNVDLTPPPSCQACFTVEQAQGGGTLTPFVANFISCSDTAGTGISFDWIFPDGSVATGEFATWTFPGEGAYEVCLSMIIPANTCQSTFCDSVYVDSNGLISTTAPWYDCLGVLNGTALPGTPCDDGDPDTVQDHWDASCNCSGIPCTPLPDELELTHGLYSAWCSTDSILQGITNITQDMQPVHYAWGGLGPNATDSLPWVQLFQPGTYTVTVSNACSTTEAFFVIIINQAPDAGISASITVCSTSDPFSMFDALGGTPDAGGNWTGPGPTLPIFDPAIMPAGVYTYTVPGAAPCPDASATLTVFFDDDQHWYADADGDGLGDPDVWVIACEQPAGYVGNADDACPQLFGTVGDACDDGNPFTINDMITEDCVCQGTSLVVDCLGIPGGTALPGTECTVTDGGVQYTGIWTMDCECDTTGPDDCEAGFWPIQAYEVDTLDPNGGATPIPNEVWVWNLSSGGNGTYQFLWDFGDGNTSTEAYPTHHYDGPGPYQLCLTLWSGACTDTYCDSISMDENGFLNGLIPEDHDTYRPSRSGGFTLRVIHTLPTGIAPALDLGEVRLWPNPAGDQVNLSFTSQHVGPLSMAIMDLGGRVVWSGTHDAPRGPNTLAISVERLRAGAYLLQVGEGGNRVMLRFIKM